MNKHISLILIIIFVTALSVNLFACGEHPFIADRNAKTEGYKLYTGKAEGLQISFEYPITWTRSKERDNEELKSTSIWLYSNDFIMSGIDSLVNKEHGGDYINAADLISPHTYRSIGEGYRFISQDNPILGQVEANEVVYSFIELSVWRYDGKYSEAEKICRILTVDYKERIYLIKFIALASNYEQLKPEIDHLLATFKFLD